MQNNLPDGSLFAATAGSAHPLWWASGWWRMMHKTGLDSGEQKMTNVYERWRKAWLREWRGVGSQTAPTLARAGEDAAITDPLPTARCQQ